MLKINNKIVRNEGLIKSIGNEKKFNIKNIYNDAKKIIPGGTQLFSKRAELYHPDIWPTYYLKAKGINIRGLDKKNYKDFCNMSVGASILGYCDDYVDKKVIQSIKKSVVTTLNNYDEVKLAKNYVKFTLGQKKLNFVELVVKQLQWQ